MSIWSEAPRPRGQSELIAPSLDEQIGPDAGVRFLDALLAQVDWSEWEACYHNSGPGRPTHHPRVMCSAILYGLMQGIDTTRRLEHATLYHLDFHWLLDGRSIDHTTFAKFRTLHAERIKSLFVQINRTAARIRRLSLEEVVIDGTRVRADSDRFGARSAAALQRRLDALEERIKEAVDALEQAQAQGDIEEAARCEQQQKSLRARHKRDEKALKVAQERDQAKEQREGARATAVRVPVTDPEAHLLPNKEGGFAPNFTPVVAVESQGGLILAAHINETNTETDTTVGLVEEVEQSLGTRPRRVLADEGFGSGEELEQLQSKGVQAYVPLEKARENPALRADPRQPVDPQHWERLPRRDGQLSREAFVYESAGDVYYCPMGHPLSRSRRNVRRAKKGQPVVKYHYRGAPCAQCPLASRCLKGQAKSRTIIRDQYESCREQVRARMRTEQGRKIYARRAPCVEGVFGTIKSAMGIRRFRRRGLEKVREDWLWVCLAFNLKKLTGWLHGQDGITPPAAAIRALCTALDGAIALKTVSIALRRALTDFLHLSVTKAA